MANAFSLLLRLQGQFIKIRMNAAYLGQTKGTCYEDLSKMLLSGFFSTRSLPCAHFKLHRDAIKAILPSIPCQKSRLA